MFSKKERKEKKKKSAQTRKTCYFLAFAGKFDFENKSENSV